MKHSQNNVPEGICSVLETNMLQEGFSNVAFIPAKNPTWSFRFFYKRYLRKMYHADMYYLENTASKFNIKTMWEGESKPSSIMIGLYPYRTKAIDEALKLAPYKIARYAWSKDYHKALKKKISKILDSAFVGTDIKYRVIVDSTPFPERYYARKANLGFIGKNGMLIHPTNGSYFFIIAVLVSHPLHLEQKNYNKNHISNIKFDTINFCGECNRCVISCPTQAILDNSIIDSNRCISYWTIESKKKEIPIEYNFGRWVFGCDVCQMVCPYNKGSLFTSDVHFPIGDPVRKVAYSQIDDVQDDFLNGFVLKRAGLQKIRKYITIYKNKENNSVRNI